MQHECRPPVYVMIPRPFPQWDLHRTARADNAACGACGARPCQIVTDDDMRERAFCSECLDERRETWRLCTRDYCPLCRPDEYRAKYGGFRVPGDMVGNTGCALQ